MPFQLKFKDVIPKEYIKEWFVSYQDDGTVTLTELPVEVDGCIDEISHAGGVDRSSTSNGGKRYIQGVEVPFSTNKLLALLGLLNSDFACEQGEGFKLYEELVIDKQRELKYYTVVLQKHRVAIVICDQYAEGVRVGSFPDYTPDQICDLVSENVRKGDLDKVGFQMHAMYRGGYDDLAICCNFLTDLLNQYLTTSADMSAVVNKKVELVVERTVEQTRIINFLKQEDQLGASFKPQNLTYNFVKSLPKSSLGFGPRAIATRLGVKVNGVDYQGLRGFLQVLRVVYDDERSLEIINGMIAEYVRIENLTVDDIKTFLKQELRVPFKPTVLTVGFLQGLSKSSLGIGANQIVTKLGLEDMNDIIFTNPKGFLYVLRKVYEGNEESLAIINGKIAKNVEFDKLRKKLKN